MNKITLGAMAILLAVGLTFSGCNSPISTDLSIDETRSSVSNNGNSNGNGNNSGGAGYAGLEEGPLHFLPKNSEGTVSGGVVRMGPSSWAMALMFNSDNAERVPAPNAQPVTRKETITHPAVTEWVPPVKKWVAPVKEWVPPVKAWIDPIPGWVPPVFEWTEDEYEYFYHQKDVYGFITQEAFAALNWGPEYTLTPRWGSGSTGYGGWAKSVEFPVPQNKNDPRINNGNFIEHNGVYRGGQNWTDMAIVYSGQEVKVDLISGQDKVVGYVVLEPFGSQVKISIIGDDEKDIGIINHIGMYSGWWQATSPMLGEGNWNGNQYHNMSAAYFDYDAGSTVYIFVKGKVNPYLGLWGKIAEEDDLSKEPEKVLTVPAYETDTILVPGYKDYDNPVKEGYWKTISRGYYKTVTPGYWKTVKEGYDKIITPEREEEICTGEIIGYSSYVYKQTAGLIGGQNTRIGDFSVIADDDGVVTLAWCYYTKGNDKSNITYITFGSMFDRYRLPGEGTWPGDDVVSISDDGFFYLTLDCITFAPGETFYIAAHCKTN